LQYDAKVYYKNAILCNIIACICLFYFTSMHAAKETYRVVSTCLWSWLVIRNWAL